MYPVLLLAGERTGCRHDTDRELVFRQESNFFYLTGCNVPAAFVLAVAQPGEQPPAIDLFIPEADEDDIMWSVPPPPLAAAAQSHDVTRVEHTAALEATLAARLAALPGALVHTLPRASPLYPALPPACTARALAHDAVAVTDFYLLAALQNARLTKDAHEIALIRRANAVSSRAHEVVMRVLGHAVRHGLRQGAHPAPADPGRPLLPGEWLIEKEAEAEAVFVASCRREGAVHQAYCPIVAASTRAATLHYCCNDREFAWGPVSHAHAAHDDDDAAPLALVPQVLLIDAGCEWNNYASDITRTMPVGNGGKFAPAARAVYALVREMQSAAFALLRPGVHWDAVQLACHRALVRGFCRLGIFRAGTAHDEDAVLASGITAAFFPHGLGHSLGLDVHDVPGASKCTDPVSGAVVVLGDGARPGDEARWGHQSLYRYLRLRRPLECGMVVTVEPGIYFSPHLLRRAGVHESGVVDVDVLRRYEDVGGVRIEDVVVITEDGYENLTTVRSDIEWLEGVCSGVL
ncbi:hypothetical protein C0993_007596 [Termitomyces sp. T159_Od127]|nr:hypothetical protein C0993_007596 [Termitomyces sp. T159_Od127]